MLPHSVSLHITVLRVHFEGTRCFKKTYPQNSLKGSNYAKASRTLTLCKLAPTPRRKPPVTKQNARTDDRTSAELTTVPAKKSTGTTTENNVFIPLHTVNSIKRIVGVKAKSGIKKQSLAQVKQWRTKGYINQMIKEALQAIGQL